jgi:uncharacterized SAM-binding protein YcdF (DUF218 family)
MASASRILEALVQPIGLIWLLNLGGAAWLLYRRKWREAAFCGTIAALLFVVGSTSVPVRLLATLERPYAGGQPVTILSGDAVVMLGGTLSPSSEDVFRFDLNDGADRAITAAELIRQGKARTLIIGGGGRTDNASENRESPEAQLLKSWLVTWGLTNAPVICLNASGDTHDEAVQVHLLAQTNAWQRLILVTSAYHMKRAEALFHRLGVAVAPVACDFVALSSLERKGRFNPVPQADGFGYLQLYLHEKIGWFMYLWRGWI